MIPTKPRNDLKKCPFCGSYPHEIRLDNEIKLACLNDYCEMMSCATPYENDIRIVEGIWEKRYTENNK